MDKIVIKLIEHPDNPQMTAKFVNSKEYLTPKTGKDGKTVTGVDENAYSVLSIEDSEERKRKQKEIQKVREELERKLGVDLGPSSSFWNDYFIILEDEKILDPLSAKDKLDELFLLANRYVAPDKEAILEDPDYFGCLYYIYRDKEATAKKARASIAKDKAVAKLLSLFETNPNKLKQVAAEIIGFDPSDIDSEEAYVKLKERLDSRDADEQKKNIKRFLEVVEMSPEKLLTKKILDKAIKKRIVTAKGGIYRRHDQILGNNYEEALEYLGTPENSAELASLQKEVR